MGQPPRFIYDENGNKIPLPDQRSEEPSQAPALSQSQPVPSRWLGFQALTPSFETLKGVGKGVLGTLAGLAELGSSFSPLGDTSQEFNRIQQSLEPTNPHQRAGKTVEQIAEFMVPFGQLSKAPQAASRLYKGGKALLQMGTDAAVASGKTAVQTRTKEPEDLVTAALLGATQVPVSGLLKAVGNVVFAKLPERLYSQIFKESYDDLAEAYKTEARGKAIDPVLAKEILDRGLFGSSRNMAIYSYRKLDALEVQLKAAVAGKGMYFPQKQDYIDLLGDIASEFGSKFGKTGARAEDLINKLANTPGRNIAAEDALNLKRLLDKVRSTSSFRMSPKLSPKQDEYKGAADKVRSLLHKTFPNDVSKLLDEERVFIEAFDSIVKDAIQRNNRKLLGMTDYILGGGGMAAGVTGAGIGAAAAVRGFQNPFTLTGLGHVLDRTGKAMPSGTAVAGGLTGVGVVAGRKNEPITPPDVKNVLGNAAVGDYKLSDGTWWRKDADGTILPIGR